MVFTSCSQEASMENTKTTAKEQAFNGDSSKQITTVKDTLTDRLTVMVVPCSNGYEYDLKKGDLNPSLEKYLGLDERIILKPFPLKKMRGTGYFGVFDKKYCEKILEKVDVDFLILTRMKGLDGSSVDTESGHWGYDTKIVDAETMYQFNGISARDLKSFESIDPDIQSKIDALIRMIIESRKE